MANEAEAAEAQAIAIAGHLEEVVGPVDKKLTAVDRKLTAAMGGFSAAFHTMAAMSRKLADLKTMMMTLMAANGVQPPRKTKQ